MIVLTLAALVVIAVANIAFLNIDRLLPAANNISFSDISETDLSSADASRSDTVTPADLTQPQPEIPDSATIQFTGDVLLHEGIYSAAKSGSKYNLTPYFSMFEDVFKADLCVANLETPINARGKNSKIQGFPVFNAPSELAETLAAIGINACVTANNHTVDMGYSGVKQTISELSSAGIRHIGTYTSKEEAAQPIIFELNGIKVGFAAFTDHNNGSVSDEREYCIKVTTRKKSTMLATVKPEIDKLKEAGAEFIIISMHWGEEYSDSPTATQTEVAELLCQYGADVIMGTHSHCVQPARWVTVDRDGKTSRALVMYSLGNFFADQSLLKTHGTKAQQGVVFSLKIEREEDGTVVIDDCFYTPTFAYAKRSRGANYIRVMPAGKYALAEERHSFFKDDAAWKKCKNAYTRVQEMVGGGLTCIPSPDEYPVGFFAEDEDTLSGSDIAASTSGGGDAA